jgi:holliday junction DNA helicase RuvA
VIGKVSGVLDYRASDHVLVDTGGVGYLVYCSERTLAALPGPGGAVALFTDLVVREDLMQLYGFATLAEREWHRLLTTVQGVGARAALAILGALGTDGLARAIAVGDAAAIRRAPGIGPKIAERVVLELKRKAPGIMAMGAAGARPAAGSGAPVPATDLPPQPAPAAPAAVRGVSAGGEGAQATADALSALVNLGYGYGEAAAAVAEAAAETPEAATPALIRAALRRLAPGG